MPFTSNRLTVTLPITDGSPEQILAEEPIIKGVCIDAASFAEASCGDEFSTYLVVHGILFSSLTAEQLPILREQLETQLKAVDDAEKALEAGASDI